MSTKKDDHTKNFLNFGTIALRESACKTSADKNPITVIVSGVGRSGTSMTAAVLSALGIPMGNTKSAVLEDEEFLHALLFFNFGRLAQLVNIRNAATDRWGFKFASLQNHLLPPQLKSFRNPHLIIVMRDPVAIAARAQISDPEIKDATDAFFNVTKQSYDMANFVANAPCPTLLLSYEKFLSFPAEAIACIAAFCGIELTEAARAQALAEIAPNNTDYLKLFHKEYKGHLNGIRHGRVFGWCCALNNNEPVAIELLADGKVIATTFANIFREDLKKAGIGEGVHAFEIDISHLGLNGDCILRVQAAGTDFVLQGSDASVVALQRH
jgi:hypothetical protein